MRVVYEHTPQDVTISFKRNVLCPDLQYHYNMTGGLNRYLFPDM